MKDFKSYEEMIKYIKEYENRIDKLAEEYILNFTKPECKNEGYYAIVHYCLGKIKENDKNSSLGYIGVCTSVKKED